MYLLHNLTIRAKLALMIALASLLLVAVGLSGLLGTRAAQQVAKSIYEDRLVVIDIFNKVRNYQNITRVAVLAARLETDAFEILAHADRVRSNVFQIEQLLQQYSQRPISGKEKALFDDYVAKRQRFGVEAVMPMLDLLQAEKRDEAEALFKSTLEPLYAQLSNAADALIEYHTGAAQQEYAAAAKQAKATLIISIASIVIGVALSVVLGFFIARGIARGVAAVERAAGRLADGDLTASVDIQGKDELAQIAASFNRMARHMAEVIGEVRASSSQVSQNADAMAGTASQVADSSRTQTQRAAEAASSVESLNQAFKDIAVTSENIVRAANEARDFSEQGNRVVADAVQGIEKVARTVSDSAATIAELGQRSTQIGQILSVIKDIADQTNLLALNAAIEAARAGEQGRGFAVVADEVRKLAERTAAATNEITAMIGAIQKDTAQAVTTMEQGSSEVREGVALANQAGQALANINRSVAAVVEMIGRIADATRAQSQASDTLTATVEEIARMARANSAAVEETAAVSREMVERSHQLQAAISRFRS